MPRRKNTVRRYYSCRVHGRQPLEVGDRRNEHAKHMHEALHLPPAPHHQASITAFEPSSSLLDSCKLRLSNSLDQRSKLDFALLPRMLNNVRVRG